MKIVPVVLAGGTGTRLWPLSRNALPKQFIALTSNLSLFQETLLRTPPGPDFLPPVVITNGDYRFYVQRQAQEVGIEPAIILEPARRDSAPALVVASAYVARRYGPETLILALASDHVVREPEKFRAAVTIAAKAAALGRIVTFGIAPDSPRTSYGYINPGAALGGEGAFEVDSFVEKPDAPTAQRYLDAGYLWNSGNFLFPAELLISEAMAFEPELTSNAVAALELADEDIGFIRLDPKAFEAAPAKSIDFAVLEHTRKSAVVRGDFSWSDLGSWDAVYEVGAADGDGNVVQGPVALLDSSGSYVRSEGPLVACIGLENVSVVATSDAVLVMPTDRSQDVKDLVTQLKKSNRREADVHQIVHRPWGTYETVCLGDRFQVKKIVVEPGGVLSLQKHHHRAEHWIVVRGTAEVTLADRKFTVHENESTYIPLGNVHRLANPGRIRLELIEVQTGSYLGEDDIVRLENIYQRA
ncbi:mannose-1-phosphate guanylyltransferase/mannose-6-phosphate isomerase [Xanthobacter dioxanivorans]|uniref:mannose-1-phosphate guanylyltransferase n=1 Tax=Xanthobacter dioxanivorans TaxID=2528964 RepID=A0A974PLV1_9HYPH|nr:mannose-1-phosphate guanylyltransferase/mannose-6-phosphate isomerase [Xanthobacter dioxanivorans]QRG05939.1 mannose-1-phosphate guanylyltransferase/mannose-6-phosphate isomerase [Xanthobacter dioxanivorans]